MLPRDPLDGDTVMLPDDWLDKGRVGTEVERADVGPEVDMPVEDAWVILRDGIPGVDIGPGLV